MWKYVTKKHWSRVYKIWHTGLIKLEGTKYLLILGLELFFQRPTFSIFYPGDGRDGGTEPIWQIIFLLNIDAKIFYKILSNLGNLGKQYIENTIYRENNIWKINQCNSLYYICNYKKKNDCLKICKKFIWKKFNTSKTLEN